MLQENVGTGAARSIEEGASAGSVRPDPALKLAEGSARRLAIPSKELRFAHRRARSALVDEATDRGAFDDAAREVPLVAAVR